MISTAGRSVASGSSAVGNFLETGVGVGYYQRTVPSGLPRLRQRQRQRDRAGSQAADRADLGHHPLPAGRSRGAVEPYIGGGIGFINWRYSESGEFVDFSDDSMFRDHVQGQWHGRRAGVCRPDCAFPVGDAFTAGFEYRWQKAEGDTKPAESELARQQDRSLRRRSSVHISRCTSASEPYGVAL